MKYLTEYRDARLVRATLDEIRRTVTRPWVLMEICGGQTHSIVRHGLDELLPPEVELVHGPGCPVCVTPLELIDKALAIAAQPNVIFTSYGDMLRVPGSGRDLFAERAQGADVRVVYSPLDAVRLAQQNPDKQVVFFAIGFETTAPANAMSVLQARALGVTHYSVLVSHVCAVMGYWEYHPLAAEFQVPMVVTGFEPLDLAQGILQAVRQLEAGTHVVENAYARAVTEAGNIPAQRVIAQVFEVRDRKWRGVGLIPASGWGLRPEFAAFDAEQRFAVGAIQPEESPVCMAGQILQGLAKPQQCPAFGKQCTPEHPLGATMVSSEGACAAYYRYRAVPEAEVA